MAMSNLEAANYLREKMKEDVALSLAVTEIVARNGCDDMYDWADEHPQAIKDLVAGLKFADEQFDEYDDRLSRGDLS